MPSSDAIRLLIDGSQCGPYSIDKLCRLAKQEAINHRTLFWSDRQQQWLPLTALMFDLHPNRLEEMRGCGVKFVEVICSGTGEDCIVCRQLTGKTYDIDVAPVLPPDGCTCNPWCRCMFIAVRKRPIILPLLSVLL
jgi:hypothetical protein